MESKTSVITPMFHLEANGKFYSTKGHDPYGDLAICRRNLQKRLRVPLTKRIQFEIIKNDKSGKFYFEGSCTAFPWLIGPNGNLGIMVGPSKWLKDHLKGFKRFDIDILLLGD